MAVEGWFYFLDMTMFTQVVSNKFSPAYLFTERHCNAINIPAKTKLKRGSLVNMDVNCKFTGKIYG